jgi:hypothetical protein
MTLEADDPLDPELAGRFQELKRAIDRTYARIWEDWYAEARGAKTARLVVKVEIKTSGYSVSTDTICLYVGERNLEDDIDEDAAVWPQWKRDLVHEMLHEYEAKGLRGVSPAGDALLHRHPHAFEPRDHQATYFSAIVEKAPYFQMTPEEFLTTL